MGAWWCALCRCVCCLQPLEGEGAPASHGGGQPCLRAACDKCLSLQGAMALVHAEQVRGQTKGGIEKASKGWCWPRR